MSEIVGKDLYLRITKANGQSHVQHHRVWNKQLYVESITRHLSNVKDPNDKCTVAVINETEYRKEK